MFQDSIYMRVSLVALVLATLFTASQAWVLAAQTYDVPIPPIISPAWAQTDDCRLVKTFTGEGTQQTQPFEVTSDTWRLRYTLEANTNIPNASYLDITIYNADNDQLINFVTLENPGSDTSFVNEGAGRYYLDIGSANGRWEVVVEDCGADPEETMRQEDTTANDADDDPNEDDNITIVPSPPPPDPPTGRLARTGGPEHGPFPLMPNGECPRGFPVERDGACYPR